MNIKNCKRCKSNKIKKAYPTALPRRFYIVFGDTRYWIWWKRCDLNALRGTSKIKKLSIVTFICLLCACIIFIKFSEKLLLIKLRKKWKKLARTKGVLAMAICPYRKIKNIFNPSSCCYLCSVIGCSIFNKSICKKFKKCWLYKMIKEIGIEIWVIYFLPQMSILHTLIQIPGMVF